MKESTENDWKVFFYTSTYILYIYEYVYVDNDSLHLNYVKYSGFVSPKSASPLGPSNTYIRI